MTGRKDEYTSEHSFLSERLFLSVTQGSVDSIPFSFTSRGLHLTLPLYVTNGELLACVATLEDPRDTLCLFTACVRLKVEAEKGKNNYRRSGPLVFLPETIYRHDQFQLQTVYVYQPYPVELVLLWLDISSDRCTLIALEKAEHSNTGTHMVFTHASMQTIGRDMNIYADSKNNVRNAISKTAPEISTMSQGLNHATHFLHKSSDESNGIDLMLENDPCSRFCVSFNIGYEVASFGVYLRSPWRWRPYQQCLDVAVTAGLTEHGWNNNDRLTLCIYINRTGMDIEGHQISMSLRRVGAPRTLSASRRFVFSVDHKAITPHDRMRPLFSAEYVVSTIDADPHATGI
jgi:hypothetical protein